MLLLMTRMLLGAVLIYPALPVVAPFGVNRSEWGPILFLVLVVVRHELLWRRWIVNVLWWHLGSATTFLLEKRVEIRLVFLV